MGRVWQATLWRNTENELQNDHLFAEPVRSYWRLCVRINIQQKCFFVSSGAWGDEDTLRSELAVWQKEMHFPWRSSSDETSYWRTDFRRWNGWFGHGSFIITTCSRIVSCCAEDREVLVFFKRSAIVCTAVHRQMRIGKMSCTKKSTFPILWQTWRCIMTMRAVLRPTGVSCGHRVKSSDPPRQLHISRASYHVTRHNDQIVDGLTAILARTFNMQLMFCVWFWDATWGCSW